MEGEIDVAGMRLRFKVKRIRGLTCRFYSYSYPEGSMSPFDHGELGQLADEEVERLAIPLPPRKTWWVRAKRKRRASDPEFDPAYV